MANTLYLKGIENLFEGGIDTTQDDFRLSFMASGYTPNSVTHEHFDDISASVASGISAIALTNVAVSIDGANNRVKFTSDGVTDDPVTTTTNKFVIYKWTGTASTSVLLACIDITEGELSPINGEITVNPSADGWFAIKAVA